MTFRTYVGFNWGLFLIFTGLGTLFCFHTFQNHCVMFSPDERQAALLNRAWLVELSAPSEVEDGL